MLNDLHSVLRLNVLNHLVDMKFLRQVVALLSFKFRLSFTIIDSQLVPQFRSFVLKIWLACSRNRTHRCTAVEHAILIELLRRNAASLNAFRIKVSSDI